MDPSVYCHRKGAGLPPSAAAFLVSPLRPYGMASRLPWFSAASGFGTFVPRTLKTAQGRASFAPDQGPSSALFETSQISSFGPRVRFGFRSFALPVPCSLFPVPFFQDQALDRLVSSSSIRYRTSTDDLSTLSSSRGLTRLKQWQFSSLGGLHA